jgi:hypothetical protein
VKSNPTHQMRQVLTGVLLAGLIGAAQAEEALPEYTFLDAVKAGKNMTSFRLRYEHVDQEGKAEKGNALTLRSLIGWQTAPFHNLSFGVQIIDVSKLENRYDDRALGVAEPGKGQHPIIVDPDNTDINQLYVDWTGIRNTKFRVGRQQINLDNVRYIGDIGFRQVMQVFDGISVINKSIPDTEITVAHFDRVKQINTRLRSGDLDIINAKYRISPSESLIGYGYFNNFNDLGFNGVNGLGAAADASNKTLGARLDGARVFTPEWKGLYTAEYAKQDEYSGGDDRIDAHYYRLVGGAMYKTWFVRFDHETLSSNDSQYAFQTPFGTNHLFQGWADQFLVTPRQGIKDNFVTFGGKPINDLVLLAEYHVFNSDEDFGKFGGGFGDKYGKEFDVSATYTVTPKFWVKAEYANFQEEDRVALAAGRKPDLEKVWLTAMYTF